MKRHNKLRVRIARKTEKRITTRANARFRKDSFKYAKKVFEGTKTSKDPSFSAQEAEEYFIKTYTDNDRNHLHIPMDSMRRPPPPHVPFNVKPPDYDTFSRIVAKKSNDTTLSYNGLNYIIYKRCGTARWWLYLIICLIWPINLPMSWAIALGVLIYKAGSEAEVPNFRPIMMTDCSGKIFFSDIALRLEAFLIANKYIDRSKQKGFLSFVAGCLEHVFTLQEALKDSKPAYRQIVISWLDLWNAYGSVPHNLIQFALAWYHVPEVICELIFKYYELLQASVTVNRDKTGFFRFEIGFFQGCVLSAILFDCVFILLLDLLKPISETYSYAFKSCDVKIMDLAYADDESNVTKSSEGNQKALDIIDSFLKWSRNMRAKPEKCFSFAQKFFHKIDKTGFVPIYKEKTFSPFDPKLTISGQPITFINDTYEKMFKFLGWKMYVDLTENATKEYIKEYFIELMTIPDKDPVNGFIKLWLYQHYVLLMFSWPFQINDLNVSFAKDLEVIANRYLKKWAGIFRNAKLSLLYGPKSQFGLDLTSVSIHYKLSQVSKCYILKNADDLVVADIYGQRILRDADLKRIWKASSELEILESTVSFNDMFMYNTQTSRQGLGFFSDNTSHKDKVKNVLKKRFHDTLHSEDCSKSLQGVWTTFKDCAPFDLSWNHLVSSRNTPLISWVLNASINSVCTPDMLKLWNLAPDASCILCGHECASLLHILSHCSTALTQKRYTWRHDSVLLALKTFLEPHIVTINVKPIPVKKDPMEALVSNVPKIRSSFVRSGDKLPKRTSKPKRVNLLDGFNDWQILVDFDHANIVFPVDICVTPKRPDIIIWSRSAKKVILIELTCPMEENILAARATKHSRYRDDSKHGESLIDQIKGNEWTPILMPIEVGARGMVSYSVNRCLQKLGYSPSQTKAITRRLSLVAAKCSYAIYRSRTVKEWKSSLLVETKPLPHNHG
jgi:hypothetical protein